MRKLTELKKTQHNLLSIQRTSISLKWLFPVKKYRQTFNIDVFFCCKIPITFRLILTTASRSNSSFFFLSTEISTWQSALFARTQSLHHQNKKIHILNFVIKFNIRSKESRSQEKKESTRGEREARGPSFCWWSIFGSMSTLGGNRGERDKNAKPKFQQLDINSLYRSSRVSICPYFWCDLSLNSTN